LFAIGATPTLIRTLEKKLLKTSEDEYNLNVVLEMTDATAPDKWIVLIITKKINKNSTVVLNVIER